MRNFLSFVSAFLVVAEVGGAEFTVVNKCPPAQTTNGFTVVNKTKGDCPCGSSCACPAGTCPSSCPFSVVICDGEKCRPVEIDPKFVPQGFSKAPVGYAWYKSPTGYALYQIPARKK